MMSSARHVRRWRRPLFLAAATVAAALMVTAVAAAGPGDGPSPKRATRSCADFTTANNLAESHEVFDGATGHLIVATPDGNFVFLESDSACRANPLASRRLQHAREMENQNRLAMCASFRQAIAENRAQERGLPVNLDAARRYVARECS